MPEIRGIEQMLAFLREILATFPDWHEEELGPDGASAGYFVMDEKVMCWLLRDPQVAVSSDGSPTMLRAREARSGTARPALTSTRPMHG